MSKLEASSISQPSENASASAGVGDVMGEFASSTWKAGVVRPLYGAAQLVGVDVRLEPERNLTGAMRAANIAGSAVGTLTDIVLLSRVVGKGVGALGQAAEIKPLMAENSLAKSLTTSGTTGFVDGFAFNPTQPGEGMQNRFYHGVAEGAGFMALDGSARLLGRLPEGAITNTVSRYGEKAANKLSEISPAWASDAGRSAADFLGRNAQKAGDIVSSRFPSLTAENMSRNAIAGLIGGDAYYSMDTALNGKQPSLLDGESTSLGWAAANAFLGGKLGMARPAEARVAAKPEPPAPESDAPTKVEAPAPPSYKPEFKTLENGDQQWTYKDVPNAGDETTYTKNHLFHDSYNPQLDWQIKTADGKVYDRNTKGPWEVNYPDGSSLLKNESNYLSFSKPITVEIGGKPLAVKEVTQLEADQKAIAKQWVYEDPAVPNQTVTFNADRTWEAVGADGKGFSYRSPGPWKVTNIDGYVETLAAGSKEIDVEHIAGHSNWRDFVGSAEHNSATGISRKPRAFSLSASDTSPMSLSAIPRTIDMSSTHAENSTIAFVSRPRSAEEAAAWLAGKP